MSESFSLVRLRALFGTGEGSHLPAPALWDSKLEGTLDGDDGSISGSSSNVSYESALSSPSELHVSSEKDEESASSFSLSYVAL